jgi:hypothetical protein
VTRVLHCDFCHCTAVTVTCPAVDVTSTAFPDPTRAGHYVYSQGDWLACDACAELIKRGDRVTLALRGVHALRHKLQVDHGDRTAALTDRKLMIVVRGMHDTFWAHRNGPLRALAFHELQHLRKEPNEVIRPVAGPPPPAPGWYREVVT